MSFILRHPEKKKDMSGEVEEGGSEKAETEAKENKAKQDEEIKKRLNDPKFLNFLQKNPDATDNASDDNYLREKIATFDTIQGIKNEVKKFIVTESSTDFGDVVEGPFMDSLEGVAIKNPEELGKFSKRIVAYLEATERNKALEGVYQETAKQLEMSVDYSKLTTDEKIKFVRDVQLNFSKLKSDIETKLSDTEKNRGILTHFSTKARTEFRAKRSSLQQTIAGLKVDREKLDQKSIVDTLQQIKGIRESLKGNEIFEVLKNEFHKKAQERMKQAGDSLDYKPLAKNRVVFERMRGNESILDDDQFEAIQKRLIGFAKGEVGYDVSELVESKEGATLNTFEKGIDMMRKRGLDLGLDAKECDEQIAGGLKNKIKQLQTSNDPQSRIKVILINRILANLE